MSAEIIRDAALRSQKFYHVRKLAEEVCRGLRPKDYVSEALAILRFVESNTRYTRDPRAIELVKAPYVVVSQLKSGQKPALDCDDQAALIAALALMVGFEVRIVIVAFDNLFYKGERQYTHVFCQVREPRTRAWLTLDPVPAPGRTEAMHKRIVAARVYPVA